MSNVESLFGPIRKFRSRLKKSEPCLGIGITLSDPVVSEVLGNLADFLWIDLEHTSMTLESLQGHLIASRAVDVASIVRVPGMEEWLIKRVIDSGAGGIIVPQVKSAREVVQVVAACRYPSEGSRGYGPRRASNYGFDKNFLRTANQDLFVCVQIENTCALSELDDILKVKGLDSIVLGPFDLAASMGFMSQPGHPKVIAEMQQIITKARRQGLWVGMGGPADKTYVTRAFDLGVHWLQSGCDFEYMTQFIGPFFQTMCKSLHFQKKSGEFHSSYGVKH